MTSKLPSQLIIYPKTFACSWAKHFININHQIQQFHFPHLDITLNHFPMSMVAPSTSQNFIPIVLCLYCKILTMRALHPCLPATVDTFALNMDYGEVYARKMYRLASPSFLVLYKLYCDFKKHFCPLHSFILFFVVTTTFRACFELRAEKVLENIFAMQQNE